jgi:hypothetical protein
VSELEPAQAGPHPLSKQLMLRASMKYTLLSVVLMQSLTTAAHVVSQDKRTANLQAVVIHSNAMDAILFYVR